MVTKSNGHCSSKRHTSFLYHASHLILSLSSSSFFHFCFCARSSLFAFSRDHSAPFSTMAAMSRLLLFILAAIPLTIYLTDDFIPSCFVFQPSRLQEICKKHIAAHSDNIKPLMKDLVLDLQKEYGPIVEDYDDARWVFNVAGGSTVCSILGNILPESLPRAGRAKLLRL